MTGLRFQRLLAAICPQRDRQWIAAMIAEAETLAGPAKLLWCAAALRLALALRVRVWALPLQAIMLALVMLVVDWTWGAFLPALVLIGLSAAVLTRGSRRRRRAEAMAVAGGTLPAAHAIANWVTPLWPHYQYARLDARDWVLLAGVAAIGVASVQLAHSVKRLRA